MYINPLLFIYFSLIVESTENEDFAPAYLISNPIEVTDNISRIVIGDYNTESVIYFKKEQRIIMARTQDFLDSLEKYSNDTLLIEYLTNNFKWFPSTVNLDSQEEVENAIQTYIIEPYCEYHK
ncbi:MAG: hypothetical protein RSE41_00325 [Clostridia bacterium]